MKEICIELEIDYSKQKKRWNIIRLLGVIGGLISCYFLKSLLGLIFLILMLLYVYFDKKSLFNQKEKLIIKKQQEFVNFVSYIIVFLENKFNVYQTIKICSTYLDKCLQKDIEVFINEIDKDKSILPYVNIANKIGTSLVMQLMTLLYQMDKSGYNARYLNKFPYLIDKVQELFMKEKIEKKKNEIAIFSMVPIIALMIVVFYMVFSIIGMVGGVIV